MLSMAPNIVFAPNMMQNAERKQRTQNTNTAPIRPQSQVVDMLKCLIIPLMPACAPTTL